MRWTFLLVLGFVACGGEAVIDPAGSGGSSSTTSATSTGSTGSTGSGSTGCVPGDCPPTSVCVDGQCRSSCDSDPFNPCPQGTICDDCATSSCPGCLDCVAACVDAPPGQCDDHDDCDDGELCFYSFGTCNLECDASDPGDTTCQQVGMICLGCQTGSCPGCEDCRDLCVLP